MEGWAVDDGAETERIAAMRPDELVLSTTQQAELTRTRDRDRRPYLREIAAALLKIAEGMPARQVALHGLPKRRKPETVYRWLAKYETGGLAALVHRPRGHRGFSPSAGSAGRAHRAPRPRPARTDAQSVAAR